MSETQPDASASTENRLPTTLELACRSAKWITDNLYTMVKFSDDPAVAFKERQLLVNTFFKELAKEKAAKAQAARAAQGIVENPYGPTPAGRAPNSLLPKPGGNDPARTLFWLTGVANRAIVTATSWRSFNDEHQPIQQETFKAASRAWGAALNQDYDATILGDVAMASQLAATGITGEVRYPPSLDAAKAQPRRKSWPPLALVRGMPPMLPRMSMGGEAEILSWLTGVAWTASQIAVEATNFADSAKIPPHTTNAIRLHMQDANDLLARVMAALNVSYAESSEKPHTLGKIAMGALLVHTGILENYSWVEQ